MKCQEAEKFILLKDSGELDKHKNQSLAAHLHDCVPCQQFQHILIEAQNNVQAREEPSATTLQNIFREARIKAPTSQRKPFIRFKPALALAASVLIGVGLFFSTVRPNAIGLEMVVNETQMMSFDDQVASVMYSGLSEDDLAFNFFMTYEGETEEG